MVAGGISATLVIAVVLALVFAPPAVGVGIEAPDFKAVDIATGDTVALSDHRGEVLLVNLWATWCDPCKAEMPEIERLYTELKPLGLRVLAVSVDEQSTDVVRKWISEKGFSFDVLHDRKGTIQDLYRAVGLPESFVIDRRGRIVKRVTGWIVHWDDPVQKALFRRLLERKTGS
jgi:cytochrome c biogenesis protein CcmG, thiol:disulfide interchange protein DsbE